ncbi:MAG TPA: DUF3962 domain-containing protein [Nostocaceae cyanobacterium]|nr:DUF3962 domain-containing protein [Nostocaceae cyanobacterium]
MASKHLLPGAWQFTKNQEYPVFQLSVPTPWQQIANSLAQQRVKLLGKGYPSVPVYSLDKIISASFPKIIKTERHGWQKPGFPWVLATEKMALFDLPIIIKDWLIEEFSILGERQITSILDRLDEQLWQWEEKPIIYPLHQPPEHQHQIDIRFQAIPDLIANEFLKNPQVTFGNDHQYRLTFYRVVRLNQGAELISWPPSSVTLIEHKESVGTADISFVINFKLQTVPWREQPMIYHHLSIRRWISKPIENIPYRGITAFVGDHRRWIDGQRQPFCFMALSIKKNWIQGQQEPRWTRAISELLTRNDSPLPETIALTNQPMYHWSDRPLGIQIAIAYDSRHTGESPCLPGVSPRDLASLDEAIQTQIEQINLPLRRVGEAVKISGNLDFWPVKKTSKKENQSANEELQETSSKKKKEPKDPNQLDTPMLRPQLLANTTFREPKSSPHTILILWETEACRDALIQQICALLDMSSTGENQTYRTASQLEGQATIYQSPYGSLCIKTQYISDLAQRLDVKNPDVPGKNLREKRKYLIEQRIEQIKLSLPQPEGLSGALVEIKPKSQFWPRESDPKLALRIGIMQAGYVNQHINPIQTKKDEHRVQRAVLDLLRQFGVLPAPLISLEKDGIDPHLWLTCFYVFRRTRKTTASNKASTVVLMVRVNPLSGTIEATLPSLCQNQQQLQWVSYPQLLGLLLAEKWEANTDEETIDSNSDVEQSQDIKQEQKLINKFVSDCLRDCLNTPVAEEKQPRVLFMAEATNARRILPWLKNPELSKLSTNNLPDALQRPLNESEINRLLVVRLRVAKDGEVPVAIAKTQPGGRWSGLFLWQGVLEHQKRAIYLSMRQLLNTEQGTLKQQQSRLDNGKAQAGNTKPLEIAIIHHPGIEQDKLASFIHYLRSRWPYFADDVSLPFPFSLAILAKEYAVDTKDMESVEAEENEESDDLDEFAD